VAKVIYEQVDATEGRFSYSWILDGVAGTPAIKRKLAGWTWTRGPGRGRGVYVTTDPDLAAATANEIGCDIVSNDTHKAHPEAACLLCIDNR
jgi:hypothetical protein